MIDETRCPKCQSTNRAEILWGLPWKKMIKKELKRKEIVLGGCLVTHNDPKWQCNECRTRWGRSDFSKKLEQRIEKGIGKDLKKVQNRCKKRPLLIDLKFYLYYSDEQGRIKKDLDNLLKILLDVLSVNMINGQNPLDGLGIVMDDSDIRKIKCEKQLVNSLEKEGLDLQISIGH